MLRKYTQLCEQVLTISAQAGAVINDHYLEPSQYCIEKKADRSEVTVADRMAHQLIVEHLSALNVQGQSLPVLSEEGTIPEYKTRSHWPLFWLVDPLDGTREFIEQTGEFSVNIALIFEQRPILGVIWVPQKKEGYWAIEHQGAFKVSNGQTQGISTRQVGAKPHFMVSRRHALTALKQSFPSLTDFEVTPCGSSIKMAQIAEGNADIYPRLGPTSEWDTAAAHCILREAGGELVTLDFQPLQYNKPKLTNPKFLALGDLAFPWAKHFDPKSCG